MVKVELCLGSTCYVNGSNQLLQQVQDMIREEGWTNEVELKGTFCMKFCQQHNGLGVRINGNALSGVNLQNAKDRIYQEVKELI